MVRRWYGGASVVALTGKSWADLDRDFRAYVAATQLSPEAQSFAKARFERAAVFGRRCPHVVDALRRKADLCRDAHQTERAVAAYRDVLAHDPHDWGARYGLGVVNLRYGDEAEGARALHAMADAEDTPRTWRDRAKDALGDGALLGGDDARAKDAYASLAAHSLDEDFARTEEVKALALADARGKAAVLALLVGARHRPADSVVAAERVGEWEGAAVEPGGTAPLAAYLVGRNLVGREWFSAAVPHLDRAIAGASDVTPRIAREAVRQRAVVACALGDGAAVARLRAQVVASDGPYASSSGRRLSTLRFLDRCSVTP